MYVYVCDELFIVVYIIRKCVCSYVSLRSLSKYNCHVSSYLLFSCFIFFIYKYICMYKVNLFVNLFCICSYSFNFFYPDFFSLVHVFFFFLILNSFWILLNLELFFFFFNLNTKVEIQSARKEKEFFGKKFYISKSKII